MLWIGSPSHSLFSHAKPVNPGAHSHKPCVNHPKKKVSAAKCAVLYISISFIPFVCYICRHWNTLCVHGPIRSHRPWTPKPNPSHRPLNNINTSTTAITSKGGYASYFLSSQLPDNHPHNNKYYHNRCKIRVHYTDCGNGSEHLQKQKARPPTKEVYWAANSSSSLLDNRQQASTEQYPDCCSSSPTSKCAEGSAHRHGDKWLFKRHL